MLRLFILIGLALYAGTTTAHTFEVGLANVPGACVQSDFQNRGVMPWQNKQNLIALDGKQQVEIVVLPSRTEEQLNQTDANKLKQCVVETSRRFGLENLRQGAMEDGDRKLATQVTACLGEAGTDLTIRFASVRTGPIQCPQGRPR